MAGPGGVRQSFNAVLSFDRSATVRLQGFDPVGKTLFDLVADESRYQFRFGDDPPLRGVIDPRRDIRLNIGAGEKLSLSLPKWLALLREVRRGGEPVAEDEEAIWVGADGKEIVCSVVGVRDREVILKRKIWLDRRGLLPIREEVYDEGPDGGIHASGRLAYEKVNGGIAGAWPDRVKAYLDDARMDIEFLEVNFSPAFPVDFFKIGGS